MRPGIGRRAFVGTVAAGLPLLATRTGLLAQGGGIAHDHLSLAETDPVIDQIVRQIALIHNGAQAGPRAAHTRALAMQLRMLAVYGKQRGLDDQTRTTLRDLVDREGRNAILYAPPDLEARRTIMRQYGFRPDERTTDVPLNPTHAQREASLDALLTNGITPVYEQLAATLDKVSDRLDRRARGVVAMTQDDWYAGFCAELWNQYQMAQLMAIPWCLTARYFAWAAPSCLAMEGGAAVLLIVYIWEC
jgi:hypothetical protein